MPDSSAPPEPIEQIHELNRLFLSSLQAAKPDALRGVGFPSAVVGALRRASPEQLDAVAQFPRALFEFDLGGAAAQNGSTLHKGAMLESPSFTTRILELTIAYCAWTTSRHSTYHARLFFGLQSDVIHTLRTTPLSKLPWLAMTRARILCAFPDAEGLWRELLLETRPEARRQLVLVALQPALHAAGLQSS